MARRIVLSEEQNMQTQLIRLIAAGMTVASIAACTPAEKASIAQSGPAGQPSSSDVNPITGARGGTNGK